MRAAIASAGLLVALAVGCSEEQRALNAVESAWADATRCNKEKGSANCKAEAGAATDAWLRAQKAGATEEQMQGAMGLGMNKGG